MHADGSIEAFERTAQTVALPIGIDTDAFGYMARAASRSRSLARLKASIAERSLIIGIDRLDYSKGLPERFAAFEHLLRHHPENRRRTTFLQIAPLTRADVPAYSQIRRELEAETGRINGEFAEFDWVPIRYLNRSLQHRTVSGFLRYAAVGLITPLRDGMNLVAKEYVAAQNPRDPGVLILSEFAGAAEELDGALIVNPYDIEGVARAMRRALDLPLEERIERWRGMFERIRVNDISSWRDRYLNALKAVPI